MVGCYVIHLLNSIRFKSNLPLKGAFKTLLHLYNSKQTQNSTSLPYQFRTAKQNQFTNYNNNFPSISAKLAFDIRCGFQLKIVAMHQV